MENAATSFCKHHRANHGTWTTLHSVCWRSTTGKNFLRPLIFNLLSNELELFSMDPCMSGDLAFRAIFLLFQFRTYFYLMVLIFFNYYCCFLRACMAFFVHRPAYFLYFPLLIVNLASSFAVWTWYSLVLAPFEIYSPKCICALFWS